MEGKVVGNSIVLNGILDEECRLEDLNGLLENIKASGVNGPVEVDFAGVVRANSVGIFTWLKFIRTCQLQLKYVNCPSWLIFQFNMIKGFFEHKSYVDTIQVPFFCEEIDANKFFTLKIIEDIPILESYKSFQLAERESDGKKYEPDIEPSRYFHFISQIKENLPK